MSNQGGNTGCSQTRNTREAAARVGLSYSMLTKLRVTGGGGLPSTSLVPGWSTRTRIWMPGWRVASRHQLRSTPETGEMTGTVLSLTR